MTPATDRNLDLLLTRAGARCRDIVVHAPAGEVQLGFDRRKADL